MTRFAKGRDAWGECGRSGDRVRLNDMVEDGYVKGLMVSRRWYEPPDPRKDPQPIVDSIALRNPSPELDREITVVTLPNYSFEAQRTNAPYVLHVQLADSDAFVLNYQQLAIDYLVSDLGDVMMTDSGDFIILNDITTFITSSFGDGIVTSDGDSIIAR
jgi:hypothetical protein